ncbi:50S ribosomal protein L16 [Candidatus Woesearchaeota archaeon]|nr:50S ribosomal protein L16 [Candidatus Woesearchaeota archaeon]
MARLRKGVSYTKVERPYTRKSKYKKKSYVKSVPVCKVTKFDMGELGRKFEYKVLLKPKKAVQLRHDTLESGRMTANFTMQKVLGPKGYYFKVRVYPHHALRENPIAAGAGADRMSTGMTLSFGKVIGIAAQVKKDQPVFEIDVDKQNLDLAKNALRKAKTKFPCSCLIEVMKNN